MNILDYIEKVNTNSNDLLILNKKNELLLNSYFNRRISVPQLKNIEGDIPSISLTFRGKILIKIGVSCIGHSYSCIHEECISSEQLEKKSFKVNLSDYHEGFMEIYIIAIVKSELYLPRIICEPKKICKENILYDFIFPKMDVCCEESLYFKKYGTNVFYNFKDSKIFCGNGAIIDLITYYNSFSWCKWAKYTNVKHISAYVDFCGCADVVIISQNERAYRALCSYSITSKSRNTFEFKIDNKYINGIIGIKLFVKDESIVYGGGWISYDVSTQKIKLGIGITTYKREKFVISSVSRLVNAFNKNEFYKEIIDICVVDNGKTLNNYDIQGATLIHNKNLGGTGGFIRNLLHYKDLNKYTHVLFMDDDASCEISSIFRCVSFLLHATNDSLAISGAMLSKNIQFLQWESCAWFNKRCWPAHHNFDLRDRLVLALNEKEDIKYKKYGAWWFFLFPLKYVVHYSFPFFVRGDDVQFSYINKFNIISLNGVGAWQEDFKVKESPMTLYLDIRSHIMHHILLRHINNDPFTILSLVWKFFIRFNLSYLYDTANAISTAFLDIQKGKQYWIENIDTNKIRKMFKEKYLIEVEKNIRKNYKNIPEANKSIGFKRATKFFRKVTLNGHLIPKHFLKKELFRIDKYQTAIPKKVFMRNNLLIINTRFNKEMIISRNTVYFFKNLIKMIYASITFVLKYYYLMQHYRSFFKEFKNDNFWRDIFGL